MMEVTGFKTKKEFKTAIGMRARFVLVETSICGRSCRSCGPEMVPGSHVVVGPSAYDRRWYANVTLDANLIITEVK